MAATPSLADLLKLGSKGLNELRKAGKLADDFTGASLVRLFCANANLEGLTLTGTEWERCELSKVAFKGADLSNAYFHGGRVDDCDFTGANLEGATFEKIRLGRCDFTGATGLDELELTDVEMNDVIGLDEALDDDDDEADDDDGEAAIVLLRDRLPRSYGKLPLSELLAAAAKHVTIDFGTPGKESEIKALEDALGTPFPADYRAFLLRFGSLRVQGSAEYGFGRLDVHGIGDLEAARESYRAKFKECGFDPAWLDKRSPKDGSVPGGLAQRRVNLREKLKLADAHVKRFFGDLHDEMRVAYQFMIPLLVVPSELLTAADCLGPDTQMYSVSLKSWSVEPPSGTFTARLLANLENVVVAAGTGTAD
jgi:hypothetical protein